MKFKTTLLLFVFISTNVQSQFSKQFHDKNEWELSSKIMLLCFKYPERSGEITFNMDRLLKLTSEPDDNLIRATIDHYYKTERYDRIDVLLKLASEQNICNLWKEKYTSNVSASVYTPHCNGDTPTNFILSQELATMFLNDQACRGYFVAKEITEDMKKKGYKIDYDPCLEGNTNKVDSIHILKIKEIIKVHGVPDYSEIGFWGMQGLTTVAIHSGGKNFTEEMLTKLTKSKEKGNIISASTLALLEDKISVQRTGKSIYGTQANIEVTNCYHVDSLRMNMGLWRLSDYIKLTGYKNMCSNKN